MHLYSKCIHAVDLSPDDSIEDTTQALRDKGSKAHRSEPWPSSKRLKPVRILHGSSRRTDAATEQNTLGGIVAYEEEERVISVKALWMHQAAHHHDGTGGCSGLRPLLVHFNKGLMHHLRQHQIVVRGQAGEISSLWVKRIHHSQADQESLHVIGFLHSESGQRHFHFHKIHHVRSGPLHKVLVGQSTLQLDKRDVFKSFKQKTRRNRNKPQVSHLLQAGGVVLHGVGKHDQHTEVFPSIRQLQNLTVQIRNEGQRKLGLLEHHLHRLRFILSTINGNASQSHDTAAQIIKKTSGILNGP